MASQAPPGAIVLYSPFSTVWWCWRHGVWPWTRVFLDLIVAVPILLLSGSKYSHALHSAGNGHFIHTRHGLIRNETEFPPGYLETALVLLPPEGAYTDAVATAFEKAAGRSNGDWTVLLLTPVFRFAYQLGLINKTFRDRYHTVQCASFVALTWRNAADVDLLADDRACYTGMYPGDLLRTRFFHQWKNEPTK